MLKSLFSKERLTTSQIHNLLSSAELILDGASKQAPIEVILPGADRKPLFVNAISVEADEDTATACQTVNALDPNRSLILLRYILPVVADYRSLIAAAFEKLATGGCLVITVPHQFLFERKLQLPSRRKSGALRFYTPGSLLFEVEEALDPNSYRVRFLADDDAKFDYSTPLSEVPKGAASIFLVIQKIDRPLWADMLESEDRAAFDPHKPTRYVEIDPEKPPPLHVVQPSKGGIERILVIKLDHRGDFIMADAAFRLLRQYYPDAHISLVCGAWNIENAKQSGLFNELIPYPFFLEDASVGSCFSVVEESKTESFKEALGDRQFDLCIDLRTFEDTRFLSKVVKSRLKAGFDRRSEFPWLDIPLSLIMPTLEGRAERGFISPTCFYTNEGSHNSFEIRFDNVPEAEVDRCLVWGPYQHLPAGVYRIEIIVEPLDGNCELGYDLTSSGGSVTHSIGVVDVKRGKYPTLSASFHEPIDAFELRLYARAGTPAPRFRFNGVRYRRAGEIIGPHQSEAMSLLIHLVAIRLQHPYNLEVIA